MTEAKIKMIQGRPYSYILCSRCGVWILADNYENGTHKNCDEYFKNLEVRKRAEARVIGRRPEK